MAFIAALIGSLIFYGRTYHYKLNPDIETSFISSSSIPDIDLGTQNFFVSLAFRENGRFVKSDDYTETWFRIKANKVTEVYNTSNTSSPPTVNRTPVNVTDCSNAAGIDKGKYQG